MHTLRHLFVTVDYPPQHGGVGRYLANVAGHLPHGTVTVLTPPCFNAGDSEGTGTVAVIRQQLVSARIWPRWIPMIVTICRIVRRESIGLLHAGQALPVGAAVWVASRISGVPYIVYTYGMDLMLPRSSVTKRWLVRRVLRGAQRVIAITEYTKGLVEWYDIPHEKILVLRPACAIDTNVPGDEASAYSRSLGLEGKQFVLSVGRLMTRKGFDTLIAALEVAKERLPNLNVVIVGDGPDRQRLASLIARYGLEKHIHLLGSVSDRQLKMLYQLCTAFAMVAREEENGADVEGFGMVYVEANAFGKPVIAGRTGGVTEAVVDGITGLLVEPRNVAQTAQAITKLCSDPNFAHRLGEAGRQRVERDFTWKETMRAYHAWLESFERTNGRLQ